MRCAGATFWEDEKQTKVKLEPAILETYNAKGYRRAQRYTPNLALDGQVLGR